MRNTGRGKVKLVIKKHGKVWRTLEFFRDELREEYIQKELRYFYYQKEGISIYCGCKFCRNGNVCAQMTIAKLNEFFYIRTYPDQTHEHEIFCPYSLSEELIALNKQDWTPERVLSSNIFSDFPKSLGKYCNFNSSKKKVFRKTYIGFINYLLAESYSHSFNSFIKKDVNHEYPLVSNKSVLKFLYGKILDFPISKKLLRQVDGRPSVKDLLKQEDLYLDIAICTDMQSLGDDFSLTLLTFDEKEYKRSIRKSLVKKFINWFSGYFSSTLLPCIFVGVRTKSGTYTRAYMRPVLFSLLDKPFVPIESSFERKVLRELVGRKIIFYKPIIDEWRKNITFRVITQISQIPSEYVNSIKVALKSYKYTPDILLFLPREIVVVELFGVKGVRKYEKLKKKKEELLSKVKELSPYLDTLCIDTHEEFLNYITSKVRNYD